MATPAFACQPIGCYSKDSKPTHALFQSVQGYLNRFARAVGFTPLAVDGVLGPATAAALRAVLDAMATSGSGAQASAIALRVAHVADAPETIARYANEVLAFLKLAASEAKLPAVAAPSTAPTPAVASNLPATFPGFTVERPRRWPYYAAGVAAGAAVLVGGYFALRAKPSAAVAGPRRKPPDRLRDQEQPEVMGYELDREMLTPARRTIRTDEPGDYGADPIGDGTFRMVPSGDIVDFAERNRRLAKKW